jgi:disulfide bond formation protein DsbB
VKKAIFPWWTEPLRTQGFSAKIPNNYSNEERIIATAILRFATAFIIASIAIVGIGLGLITGIYQIHSVWVHLLLVPLVLLGILLSFMLARVVVVFLNPDISKIADVKAKKRLVSGWHNAW